MILSYTGDKKGLIEYIQGILFMEQHQGDNMSWNGGQSDEEYRLEDLRTMRYED